MSHTGYRYRPIRRSRLTETGFPDPRPTQITTEDVSKEAILDGHVLEGEFQGNGFTVLQGFSTSQSFDVNNILNDNEKGVLIGYTPSSTYFQLFMNDGLGPMVTYNFTDKFKDPEFHIFRLTIGSDNRLEVELDGGNIIFDTKIPSISDTLYVINYSIY